MHKIIPLRSPGYGIKNPSAMKWKQPSGHGCCKEKQTTCMPVIVHNNENTKRKWWLG